jgi:hypothetical protein
MFTKRWIPRDLNDSHSGIKQSMYNVTNVVFCMATFLLRFARQMS